MAEIEVLTPTQISSSKKDRILVWRDEVAFAADPKRPSPSPSSRIAVASAPSFTSSTATKTTNTTHTATSSPLSRGRRIWARLIRRLSASDGSRPAAGWGREEDEVIATDMYRTLRNKDINLDTATFSFEGGDDAGERAPGPEMLDQSLASSGDRKRLLQTQERLNRATRLLEKHVAN